MKIIWIVYKRFDSDLSKTSREEMTRSLVKRKHEVTLVAPYSGKKPTSELEKYILFIPTLAPKGLYGLIFSIRLFFYLSLRITFRKPDVILVEPPGLISLFPFLILRKLRLIKTKIVMDIRTVPVDIVTAWDKAKELFYVFSLTAAKYLTDGLTVITPLLKKQICQEYQFKENKIGIWNSGVTLDIFNENTSNFKKKSLFDNKDFIVMYHGSLSPNRGLQNTIKAISILKDNGLNIGFFIMGLGQAYDELKSLIQTLNIQDNVILHAPVPYKEVPWFISGCDIGILPFPPINWWQVSSPLKLMEYLAMKKPVIVTAIEAHREVLANSHAGIFIQTSSPEGIALGIKHAFEIKAKLAEFGREGRKLVEEKYSWDIQGQKLINFLKQLV
jgi:glycosyltransferase involved in cell wall biosynthesis